jgi:hypothetical protein
MRVLTLTSADMVALLVRVDLRCQVELGLHANDAIVLWKDAVYRIFSDEWTHLTEPAEVES